MERQGEDYLVYIRSRREQSGASPAPKSSIGNIRKWWKRRNAEPKQNDQSSDPSPSAARLRFNPVDVERLEAAGRARRSRPDETPEAHSLSQLLRAAGGYVERKRGRLQAVSWREPSISVVYEMAGGRREVHVFRHDSMYDVWVQMYVRRSRRGG